MYQFINSTSPFERVHFHKLLWSISSWLINLVWHKIRNRKDMKGVGQVEYISSRDFWMNRSRRYSNPNLNLWLQLKHLVTLDQPKLWQDTQWTMWSLYSQYICSSVGQNYLSPSHDLRPPHFLYCPVSACPWICSEVVQASGQDISVLCSNFLSVGHIFFLSLVNSE